MKALGLTKQPFAPGPDRQFYFAFDALEQRLSLLRGLIASRDVLVLVIGERGSGKTTLLKRFLDACRSTWKVCHLRINAVDCEKLSTATPLHNHSAYVSQDKDHRTVMIDDAHVLESSDLQILLRKMAAAEQPGKVNHLVLFGEHSLSANLAAIDKAMEGTTAVNRIFMPALTQAETTAYLRHRFSIAGASNLRLFNRRVAKRIHRSTGGLPGQINTAADIWLQKRENKVLHISSSYKPAQGNRLRRFLSDVSAAGKLLSVGTLLHPNRSDNSSESHKLTSSRPMSKNGIKADQGGRRRQFAGGRKESALNVGDTFPAPEQVSTGTRGAQGAFINPTSPGTFPSVPIESAPPGKAGAVKQNIYSEDWLLCQDPTCYTIQVLGVRSEKAVAAIVKSHRLPPHRKIACFRTLYKGETAYPLLWGVYRTQSEASAAVEELPAKLKGFFPLIRRISAIQKIIRTSGSP